MTSFDRYLAQLERQIAEADKYVAELEEWLRDDDEGSQGNVEEPPPSDLRPRTLAEVIGQDALKARLRIALASARVRGEPLDHVLLSGPPGLGKTTLAYVIANELRAGFHASVGSTLQTPADLRKLLVKVRRGDVVFIDEVHRIPPVVEEVLYQALEQFVVDVPLDGDGESVRFDVPRFTLIGATTVKGNLSQPLIDRFGLEEVFDLYPPGELAEIVKRSAGIMGMAIDSDAALALASRSRGTPRIANRLLARVRDFALAKRRESVTVALVEEAMDLHGIDRLGLDRSARLVLSTLKAGTLGLSTLAATTGEHPATIAESLEPYLIRAGLIVRTARGRALIQAGRRYVGAEAA